MGKRDVEDRVLRDRGELGVVGDAVEGEDVDGGREVVLDLNDGAEGDELGSVDDGYLGNHSVVISRLVATEVEGEESLVGLGHLY